jgi:hypothetical protein
MARKSTLNLSRLFFLFPFPLNNEFSIYRDTRRVARIGGSSPGIAYKNALACVRILAYRWDGNVYVDVYRTSGRVAIESGSVRAVATIKGGW